jgi:hypothetical protein
MVYFGIMNHQGEPVTEPAARKFRFSLQQVTGSVVRLIHQTRGIVGWFHFQNRYSRDVGTEF